MFHGLTMVNFDGQTQNQMMVRPWSAMVDHGRPWCDGQTVAGVWGLFPHYITLNMVPAIIKIAAFYMATGTISRVVYIETSLGKFSFLPKFLKDGFAALI